MKHLAFQILLVMCLALSAPANAQRNYYPDTEVFPIDLSEASFTVFNWAQRRMSQVADFFGLPRVDGDQPRHRAELNSLALDIRSVITSHYHTRRSHTIEQADDFAKTVAPSTSYTAPENETLLPYARLELVDILRNPDHRTNIRAIIRIVRRIDAALAPK